MSLLPCWKVGEMPLSAGGADALHVPVCIELMESYGAGWGKG